MCGIIGYIGEKDARNMVISGLKKLEYRGYDSAGVALVNKDDICVFKEKGKIENLLSEIDFSFLTNVGIGHTRMATHGEANKINAHPHQSRSKRFTIVHNGVIENYKKLKALYLDKDIELISSTDTEIIANIIEVFARELNTLDAIRKTISVLEGSYALLILDKENPNLIYVAKNKTPIVIGKAKDGYILASDVLPLVGNADKYFSLEDKTFGVVDKNNIKLYDILNNEFSPVYKDITISINEIEKGDYPHYMLKEIYEQPSVIRRLISEYFSDDEVNIDKNVVDLIRGANKINIVAAGSSLYASYLGKYYFEKLCSIPTEVFNSSELVYSTPLIKDNPVFIFVSQSGETADSIAVLKKFKKNYKCIAITNSQTSILANLADYSIDVFAGREIAVASTKSYIAQIVVCAILAKAVSNQKIELKANLTKAALAIEKLLDDSIIIKSLAKELASAKDIFYIGRGIDYWTALEGALKLKEVGYIHTEAYSSGELKHGTIALVEEGTPVIALCTQEGTNPVVRNNLVEATTRGARGIIISSESISECDDDIIIPDVAHYLTPLVSVVVCQLIAYFIAVEKGNDVDKPKNLAKSVTVE